VNASVDPDTAIGARARAWVLAVAGEDFPPARSAELRAWLDADPRHAAAYDHAEQTLFLMDEALLATVAARPVKSSRVWLAPGLAIAAGLVAAAVLATPPASIKTTAGETREVALADGSRITLGPSSTLRPTWRLARRAYVLQAGEAFFAVAHDASRPFTVAAGETKVRVLGTRFDVNRSPGERVRVEVEQGLVEVSRDTASGASIARVAAGQGALSDTLGVRTNSLKNSLQAGAWRRGRLEYADARLDDVVADLNRYGVRVRVAPSAAGLKVTAGLRADQASAFVTGLPRVLPVSVSKEADGGVLIRPTR
jgi:transmembrane sensor